MNAYERLSGYFQQRFQRWVQRRLQPASRQQLNNRRLFIFPSRAGFAYLLVTLLLWLIGTNYENNLVLSLAFFLLSLFIVCIHHTFFNLSGLEIEYLRSAPCFLDEEGELEMQLQRRSGEGKEAVMLAYDRELPQEVDLIDTRSTKVKLFIGGQRRGWYDPGRLLVESHYPLGLVRCWSWLDMDARLLVYPKPVAGGEMPLSQGGDSEGDRLDEQGAEDFHGFKAYQPGMSPRHIAWKHYARGQGLHSKEYASYREPKLWLDWDALQGMGREARLSRLCHWVLKISATQQPYGLRLPGQEIAPGTGTEHKQQILKALALYQWQAQAGTQDPYKKPQADKGLFAKSVGEPAA